MSVEMETLKGEVSRIVEAMIASDTSSKESRLTRLMLSDGQARKLAMNVIFEAQALMESFDKRGQGNATGLQRSLQQWDEHVSRKIEASSS